MTHGSPLTSQILNELSIPLLDDPSVWKSAFSSILRYHWAPVGRDTGRESRCRTVGTYFGNTRICTMKMQKNMRHAQVT